MRIWQGERGGWPFIEWIEEVPSGQSVFGSFQLSRLKVAIFISLAIVAALNYYYRLSLGESAFAAFFLWAIFMGGGQALGGTQLPDGYGRSPVFPGPSEAESRREAIERATPIMTSITSRVSVEKWVDTKGEPMLTLVSERRAKSGKPDILRIPLDAILEFILGTDDEWFTDISMRHRYSLSQQPSHYVIVAHTIGYGVVLIAQSGRDRANMTDLHTRLLRTFLLNRSLLLARLELQLRQEREEEQAKLAPANPDFSHQNN